MKTQLKKEKKEMNRTAPNRAARSTWGNKKKNAKSGPNWARTKSMILTARPSLFLAVTDDRVKQWPSLPWPHLPWHYSPRFRSVRELCWLLTCGTESLAYTFWVFPSIIIDCNYDSINLLIKLNKLLISHWLSDHSIHFVFLPSILLWIL